MFQAVGLPILKRIEPSVREITPVLVTYARRVLELNETSVSNANINVPLCTPMIWIAHSKIEPRSIGTHRVCAGPVLAH